MDHWEESACMRFIEKFNDNYGEFEPAFFIKSFSDAIEETCLTQPLQRRSLLLYLHNDNDAFSYQICKLFQDNDIQEIINYSFRILAWDVCYVYNHLKNTKYSFGDLNSKRNDDIITNYVFSRKSSIFLIRMINNAVTVDSIIDEPDINKDNLLLTLLKVERRMRLDNETEDEILRSSRRNTIMQLSSMTFQHSEFNEADKCEDLRSNKKELTEESACMKFIETYINNYGACGVTFYIKSLSDAIKESCLTEPLKRRGLILYLHEDKDPFSKQICTLLQDDEVKEIINNSFYTLAWDIGYQYDELSDILKSLLDHYFRLTDISYFISKRKSAVLLIRMISNTVTVNSCVYQPVTKGKLLLTLREVEKSMRIDNETACELLQLSQGSTEEIDSSKFQQLMFDQLGDRDYDCFESNEHEHLKSKIGFAFYGPPQDISGYSDKENAKITSVYKKICLINDEFSKWNGKVVISFIWNCTEPLDEVKAAKAKKISNYNPSTDFMPIPIFVLRKCKYSENPCHVFIDDECRVYKSWKAYITKNKLPKCKMILPMNGKYQGKGQDNSSVYLEEYLSPTCDLSVAILKGTDIACTIVGIGSGGVCAAAMIPALAVAPIALPIAAACGAAVGVYSIVRSSLTLHDRNSHRQSMSLGNSDARGAYINIVAGSFGFFGAGATQVLATLSSKGVNIGQSARMLFNLINGANIAAGGIGVANSVYDVFYQMIKERQTPSPLTILQLSTSILFFGNAVYNFRTAGTIIEESQARVLNEFQDSLRSNRHRKTFNKLLKETVRLNGESKGKAEVISSIKNMNQVDEVMSVLTRSNRNFNNDGIRFAAKDGKIQLNGVEVDILEYGIMNRQEQFSYHLELPSVPESVIHAKQSIICSDILSIFGAVTLEDIIIGGCRLISYKHDFKYMVAELLAFFSDYIKRELIKFSKALIYKLVDTDVALFNSMKKILPTHNYLYDILTIVINFFKEEVNDYERDYQRKKAECSKEPGFDEYKFNATYKINPENTKRAFDFFEIAVRLWSDSSCIAIAISMLVDKFRTWLSEMIYEYVKKMTKKEERKKNENAKQKTHCSVCNGHFYNK